MTSRSLLPALVVGLTSFVGAPIASADFINGDFETGDLTGWTASAIDRDGNPTTPLISVESVGGNHFAVFMTGTFAAGPFISTLSQSFTVDAAEPFLIFDFSLPTVVPDPTGTGTSPFRDSFVASLDNGTDTFTLLLVDQSGALPDPFGTAPGSVTLGLPQDPFFDFGFGVDLSSLAGQTLTLFLDVTNEDDGFQLTLDPDNFQGSASEPPKIPEPSGLVLLGIGAVGLSGYAWRRRKRAA